MNQRKELKLPIAVLENIVKQGDLYCSYHQRPIRNKYEMHEKKCYRGSSREGYCPYLRLPERRKN